MILCILKSIVAWGIILLASTNLLGLVLRGLCWSRPSFDREVSDQVNRFLDNESRRLVVSNVIMTLLSVGATAGFLYALFHFWNIGLVLTATMMMLGHLPDLLYEIETGKKNPKGLLYTLATLLYWFALPLTWYSLCQWE